jgi:IS30 family transposase
VREFWHVRLKSKPSHYEIDTIFRLDQKSFLLALIGRCTQYAITRKILNKNAETVYNELKRIIASTLLSFKSITSDNGTGFAFHDKICSYIGIKWYPYHPYSYWERVLNENYNGLVRDFILKKTDFNLISNDEIRNIENILNNRIGKNMGFISPVQAIINHL